MAYDEDLANRVRELIAGEPDVSEKKMFGGLAFLVGGNMSVGASGQGGLMVRVEPKDTDALVTKPHARPFEMRGRAMQGWLRVEAEGLRTKRQLEPWVRRGVAYARSLPPSTEATRLRGLRRPAAGDRKAPSVRPATGDAAKAAGDGLMPTHGGHLRLLTATIGGCP